MDSAAMILNQVLRVIAGEVPRIGDAEIAAKFAEGVAAEVASADTGANDIQEPERIPDIDEQLRFDAECARDAAIGQAEGW